MNNKNQYNNNNYNNNPIKKVTKKMSLLWNSISI